MLNSIETSPTVIQLEPITTKKEAGYKRVFSNTLKLLVLSYATFDLVSCPPEATAERDLRNAKAAAEHKA